MTREELKTATNDELIDELNYCGYDSYYGDYRDDIVAEIKKRMQEPILDKIKEEVELFNYILNLIKFWINLLFILILELR